MNRLGCMLLLGLGLPLFGEVVSQTSISDLYFRGAIEQTGSIMLSVRDDDFADATPETPIIASIILDDGAVLGNTLVDLVNGDSRQQMPIYLAARLISSDGSSNNVPNDSVSIVRWVAGENRIWLRFQRSSSTWVRTGGGLEIAPSQDNWINLTLGQSARSSAADNQSELSNIRANTRDLDQINQDPETYAVSTNLCVDLTNSTLTSSGAESILDMAIFFFAEDAELSPGIYQSGTMIGTAVGEFRIARGFDRSCLAIAGFTDEIAEQVPDESLNRYQQKLNLNLDCSGRGNTIETNLFRGSLISLSLPVDSPFGFGDLPAFVGDWMGLAAEPFELNGKTFYKSFTYVYNGGTALLRGYDFEVTLDVAGPRDLFEQFPLVLGPNVTVTVELVNHPGEADAPPYDGIEQVRRCEPGLFPAADETLLMLLPRTNASFVAARSVFNRDYFDFVHIVGDKAYLPVPNALMVYDLTDLSSPKPIRRISLAGIGNPVIVNHDESMVLYEGIGEHTLVDLADPAGPVRGKSFRTPGRIVISNNLDFFSRTKLYLLFQTGSDPNSPIFNFAYDLSDIQNPKFLPFDPNFYRLRTMWRDDAVALRTQGLDLHRFNGQGLIDYLDTQEGSYEDVQIRDNTVYALTDNSVLELFTTETDAFVFQSAVNLGHLDPKPEVLDLEGDLLYVSSDVGLNDITTIFDISTPLTPVEVASLNRDKVTDLTSDGEKLMYTSRDDQITQLTLLEYARGNNALTEQWTRRINLEAVFWQFTSEVLLVGGGSRDVDLVRPDTGAMNLLRFDLEVTDAVTAGNNAWFLIDQSRVDLQDLTDPNNPIAVDSFPLPETAESIDIQGDILILRVIGGLRLLDAATGQVLGLIQVDPQVGEPWSPEQVAGLLAFGDSNGDTRLFDLSDPAAPQPVSTLSAQTPLAADGNLLYTGAANVFLSQSLDDPLNPDGLSYGSDFSPISAAFDGTRMALLSGKNCELAILSTLPDQQLKLDNCFQAADFQRFYDSKVNNGDFYLAIDRFESSPAEILEFKVLAICDLLLSEQAPNWPATTLQAMIDTINQNCVTLFE